MGGIASWLKGAKCNRKPSFSGSTWGFPERISVFYWICH